VCSGEQDSKVYKVDDPKSVFFSHRGHRMLELHLSLAYPGHISARVDLRGDGGRTSIDLFNDEHTSLFSIPRMFLKGPTNWDSVR
jgi:hypothetical protein